MAYLRDFDDARYLFDEGYWVKIEVKCTTPLPRLPHVLSYSLTVHDSGGMRLLGRQYPWRSATRLSQQDEAGHP